MTLNVLAICMIATSLGVFGLRNLKLSVFVYMLQTLMLVSAFLLLSAKFNASELRIWGIVAFLQR